MNTPAKEPVLKADQETLRAAWAIQEDEIEISLREKLAQLKSATKAHAQDLNARADSVTNQEIENLLTSFSLSQERIVSKISKLQQQKKSKNIQKNTTNILEIEQEVLGNTENLKLV